MTEAVIVSTARTPIGKAYRGALNNTEGPTMAGRAGRGAYRIQFANRMDMAPSLPELIALTLLAGLGCGLALAHGDLLFAAVFGGAIAMTVETIRHFP